MDAGSASQEEGQRELEVRCLLDNVQGLVDALTSVRWKKQQDAICELSEHGFVFTLEEWGCFQARVYFRKELFRRYDYTAEVRPRFAVGLGLLVDCLSTFTSSSGATALEIQYPGLDMQLLLKLTDVNKTCIYAEVRTKIPDNIPRDYSLDDDLGTPACFAVKSAALKEAIDDLEWPGSSIELTISPYPPGVTFRGEGHGDLQIDLPYDGQTELFIAFQCDQQVTFRYKYKFLRATSSNIPSYILKDNRGSKLTIGSNGLLKVQHLISVRPTAAQQHHGDPSQPQGGRVSYIEFYVLPEEDMDTGDA